MHGLFAALALTVLPGAGRLGRSFGRSASRSRYGGRPGGVQDFVRQRELESGGEAERDRRLDEIRERRALRAQERAIQREERGLVTDRRPPLPTNRLSDRLRPAVEPLGQVPASPAVPEQRRLGGQVPPSGSTQAPGFLERERPFGHVERNTR